MLDLVLHFYLHAPPFHLNFECAPSSANGDPLLTCSLRLHALFGPRDQHFVARLIAKARQGGLTHIIGAGACASKIISQDWQVSIVFILLIFSISGVHFR